MHLYGEHFGGFHFIWWIVGIIFMTYLIFNLLDFKNFRHSDKNSLDILKNRFAKGEISEEEFKNYKKILNT